MSKISIFTPNGLTLHCEKAPLFTRCLAFTVDFAYFFGLAFLLFILPGNAGLVSSTGGQLWTRAPIFETLSAFGVFFCLCILPAIRHYYHGGTPGKKMFHLRVVKENGEMPSFWDLATRELLKPLDLLPPFCLLCFTGERLGDLAARTRVVQVAPSANEEVVSDRVK